MKFILNADDFGMNKAYNDAVLEGFQKGLLKSASLCANGDFFNDATERIIPNCPNLSVGVHLNIIEGKSLLEHKFLTDKNNNFNHSYIDLILNSQGKNKKEFLDEIEKEFRAQIEKILNKTKVSHIDSHVHTHSIPAIFELSAKLASEYKIPCIRTQYEKPYIVPDYKMTLSTKFAINIIKNTLLSFFTLKNKKTVKKYNLKTNDFLIGVLYTSMMNDKSIFYGLNTLSNGIVEALIHPCKYSENLGENLNDSHSIEFQITQNEDLINKIKNKGIEITNFNSLL